MAEPSPSQLQEWLDQMNQGDRQALARLVDHFNGRMLNIARRRFHGFSRLRDEMESEDVAQEAYLRFHKALEAARPKTLGQFFGLMNKKIGELLIDLSRRRPAAAPFPAQPGNASSESTPVPCTEQSDLTWEGTRLAAWQAFHEAVAGLPELEREVFCLIFYHEHTRPESAEVLGTSVSTVRRAWRAASKKMEPHAESVLGHSPNPEAE